MRPHPRDPPWSAVSGEWTDDSVGHDANDANIAKYETPDGNGRIAVRVHPSGGNRDRTDPAQRDRHARVAFSVDDIDDPSEIAARHGCHPLRGVATYEDVYKLTYVRGPSAIIVMLAEELNKI